jgi:hypothetical protein
MVLGEGLRALKEREKGEKAKGRKGFGIHGLFLYTFRLFPFSPFRPYFLPRASPQNNQPSLPPTAFFAPGPGLGLPGRFFPVLPGLGYWF